MQTESRLFQLLINPCSRQILLQSLVSIILSYELVVGLDVMISRVTSAGLVVGLWLFIGVLALLPASVLEAAWFNGTLAVVDTVLVTGIIYVSGSARPELCIAYFVLLLVAASVRRLSHRMGLCLLLSLGCGLVLYESLMQTAAVTAVQLFGIPVLLVMAVFCGVALETITAERAGKSTLLKKRCGGAHQGIEGQSCERERRDAPRVGDAAGIGAAVARGAEDGKCRTDCRRYRG